MMSPYEHRAAAARWALVADEAEYLRTQLVTAPHGVDNDLAYDKADRRAKFARAHEEAHRAYASLVEALAEVAERIALAKRKYGGAA